MCFFLHVFLYEKQGIFVDKWFAVGGKWDRMVDKWEEVVNVSLVRIINKDMLIGEYTHTQDEKKRISLPIKFRKEMGKSVVITQGLDSCLFIYSAKEWEKISEKLGSLSFGQAGSRGLNRFMLAGASEVEVDSIGRILIPEYLRDFAKLSGKVVFAGIYNRVEVWDEASWNKYKKAIRTEADGLAEKLGEIGAI